MRRSFIMRSVGICIFPVNMYVQQPGTEYPYTYMAVVLTKLSINIMKDQDLKVEIIDYFALRDYRNGAYMYIEVNK